MLRRAPSADPDAAARLDALEARVSRDLEYIEVPLRSWVPPACDATGKEIPDVAIVGAGLSGLAIAFGLKRQGIARVVVLDAAEESAEGPWATTARMRTLRSPKTLTGPDLGVPSLTYRAWHDAVYGESSWGTLDRIDRHDWMAYLGWFRRTAGIEVWNRVRVLSVDAAGYRPVLTIERDGATDRFESRKVVLATGIEGAGGFTVPAAIGALPRARWTHSGEPLEPAALAGKRIGVIGAAASGFDWAVFALRAGAESVIMLARSRDMPRTEVLDWSNFPGFLGHFADLDDLARYRFARRLLAFKTPPTQEMYDAAHAFPNFSLMLGAPLQSAAMQGEEIAVSAGAAGEFVFDHLLLGTGYEVDLSRRPELAAIAGNIATWRDRFAPPAGEEDEALLRYPYLGPAFELTERRAGTMPALRQIHVFNNASVASLGPVSNGITGLKAGAPKIVAGLTRGLFLDDAELHYRSLCSYDKQHFEPFSAAQRAATRQPGKAS